MPKAPPKLDPADPVHGFAREMRKLRFRAGEPPLGELARAMSCSHSTVSAYLNGRRLPPPKQLESFVLACKGTAADWLQRLEEVRDQLDRLPASQGLSQALAGQRDDETANGTPMAADQHLSAAVLETEQATDTTETQDQRATQRNASSTSAETNQIRRQPEELNSRSSKLKRRTRGRNRPEPIRNSSDLDVPTAAGQIAIILMSGEGSPRENERASAGLELDPAVPAARKRIDVALIPVAAASLLHLRHRTKLSDTDLANRAIVTYEFLEAQLQAGHDLIVRDGRTGEEKLVRFL